jgi:hypothetical protein
MKNPKGCHRLGTLEEKQKVEELTLEEVCKQLGKTIKIVK